VHAEENAALRRIRRAALTRAQPRFEDFMQGIGPDRGGLDQPLRSGFRIGHHDRAAARGTFGVESGEDVEAHRNRAS
jgi:hypothetical protein